MNNCWEILDIQPSSDEKIIKLAYAKQLKNNRPDKNPDGFRRLRTAYEEALQLRYWVDEEDAAVVDDSDNSDNSVHVNSDRNSEKLKESEPFQPIDSYETANVEMLQDREDAFNNHEQEINNHQSELERLNRTRDSSDIEEDVPHSSSIDYPVFQEIENEPETAKLDSNAIWLNECFSQWEDALESKENKKPTPAQFTDERFYKVLKSQLLELNQYSLDTSNEFENELIWWMDNQQVNFLSSFELAKQHFDWESRLQGWESEQYPWYVVRRLSDGYESSKYFNNTDGFANYLLDKYPNLFKYWDMNKSMEKKLAKNKWLFEFRWSLFDAIGKQWQFVKFFSRTYHAHYVGDELVQMDNELDYLQSCVGYKQSNIQQWQTHPILTQLRDWLFRRFVKGWHFVALFVLIVICCCLLSINGVIENFQIKDMFGIFIVLASWILFWQLQLKEMVSPFYVGDNESESKALWIGAGMASIGTSALFYLQWHQQKVNAIAKFETIGMSGLSLIDIIAFQNNVNFILSHVFGLLASIVLSLFLPFRLLKLLLWHWIILAGLLGFILPMMNGAVREEPFFSPYLSPLIWLLVCLPFALMLIVWHDPKLGWLANIVEKLLSISTFVVVYGLFLVGFYCVDQIHRTGFGLTAIAICFVTVVAVYNLIMSYSKL